MGTSWSNGNREAHDKAPHEENREQDEDGRQVDPTRARGWKQAAKWLEERLGDAPEKAHDRVARVGVHPGDQRGDDDDPLQPLQRVEDDVHDGAGRRAPDVHAAARGPKRPVPIRTRVEPSSTATAKSWLMPIESSGNGRPNCAARRSRTATSFRK